MPSNKQPTQKQIKKFWEWCGFARLPEGNRGYHYEQTVKTMNWLPPYETEIYASISFLPAIDLNNLFKYAVPKLSAGCLLWYGENKGYGAVINLPHRESESDDPALALFWAIWEVIKDE